MATDRTQKVLAVLAAGDAIGPTEIARRIDEDWCVITFEHLEGRAPQSNVIMPILKPLVERGDVVREAGGKYRLATRTARKKRG